MSFYKARAIFRGGSKPVVDILHDRQNSSGKDARALCDWLNSTGLSLLKDRLAGIYGDSKHVAQVSDPDTGFTVSATSNVSYGYLYLTAWSEGDEEPARAASFF